jgi:hypothetical protein
MAQRWFNPVPPARDHTDDPTKQRKVVSAAGSRALRHASSRALVVRRPSPLGPVLTRGLLDPFLRLAGNLSSYERNLLHRCTFQMLIPGVQCSVRGFIRNSEQRN